MWILTEYIEIERRFLVDGREEKPWRIGSTASDIKQYYLPQEALSLEEGKLLIGSIALVEPNDEEARVWVNIQDWSVRVRVRDGVFFLTCKSKMSHDSAYELEWIIDAKTGSSLIENGRFPHVEKTRYVWPGTDGKAWEVDEFEGVLAGLILAEVELQNTQEKVEVPEWIGQEITGLPSWSNKALANTIGS